MAKRGERLPEVVYRKHPPLASADPSPWVRQPARHLPLFLFLTVSSWGIVAIDLKYGFAWLETASGKVSAVLVHTVDLALSPISTSAGLLRETLSARVENKDLRKEVAQLQAAASGLQSAAEENSRLRALLDLKAEVAPEATVAEVMTYRPQATQRVMVLRGGRMEGLSVGQPVLTQGAQLLGRVARVADRYCHVRLITDPKVSIGVTIERSGAQGVLYNRDGKLFVKVDRTEVINPGDRVMTSHLSDIYPEGLLVGKIEGSARADERDSFVAAQRELNERYRVSASFPIRNWHEVREVLCLPVAGTGVGGGN